VEVAKDLVGMRLTRIVACDGTVRRLSGKIVETEAYGGSDDLASHARMGPTARNRVMFGQVGRAYVYFTYGTHFCINVSARSPDRPAGAVLIRALEPIEGIDLMKTNRSRQDVRHIASGPGKLTQALQVDAALNGADLTSSKSEIYIEVGMRPEKVVATPRIGIRKAVEKKWRFIDPSSNFTSTNGIK
jgi:DNA-3-methyladenine glycosylase